MKEIFNSKYAPYFIAGLVLTILCAWFSIGFYHIDEHVQVLELASWRMGITPGASLPWEFREQVRSSLLPSIVLAVSKILGWIGWYNPFTVNFLLHLFTGIARWFITCLLCLQLSKNMITEKGKKLFVLMSLFLWFVPFISVRFTTENISGILFLYGIYILLRMFDEGKNTIRAYIIAGFLFGIAFFIRVPVSMAIFGFMIWLIKFKKPEWKYLFIMLAAGLVAIGLNISLDCIFYGKSVFTLLNFIAIYVHHTAPEMGANHWWFYIQQFAGRIMPPFGLLMIIAFGIGVYKHRKDALVWAIIPFIVVHCIIRHKELRFLFPVLFIFIYVSVLGIDYLLTKKSYLRWHKYIYAAFVVMAIPLLLFRTFTPANLSVSYCRYIYNHVLGKNVPLYVLQTNTDYPEWNPMSVSLFVMQNNYDCSYLMLNKGFYQSPCINPIGLNNETQLGVSLQLLKPDTAYYLDKSGVDFNAPINGCKVTEVYSFAPAWLVKYLSFICDDKAAGWKIYRLTKI